MIREVKQGDPLSPIIFNLVIVRGRSDSTRRLANRSTTSIRLDEYLPGDLWPTLEHEQVSHSLDRR